MKFSSDNCKILGLGQRNQLHKFRKTRNTFKKLYATGVAIKRAQWFTNLTHIHGDTGSLPRSVS